MKFKYIFLIMFTIINLLYSQNTVNVFDFPEVNKFNINVKVEIIKQGDVYFYNYTIYNFQNSEQKIYKFSVIYDQSIKNISSPPIWRAYNSLNKKRASWWASDSIFDVYPGTELSDLSFESEGLPAPMIYLSSAWVPIPILEVEPESSTNSNVFESSNKGFTISPKSHPDPFIPKTFIDTINNYLIQSDSLGWIKSKDSFDKYHSYFDKAKSCLEQNDNTATINVLGSVLTDVEVDKDKSLTSEAWALIKYNTEYLKNQILLKSKK